jgi:uncharacterized protein
MNRLRTADLLRKYYRKQPLSHQLLLEHSRMVTRKALKIARFLAKETAVDLDFVAQAAMLHDIGIIFTHDPDLNCFGDLPYLAHGVKGHEILLAEGLPRHARVCERHIGIGLTADEIIERKLPLPARDMLPETLEEKIICYADLFFSKNERDRGREKSPAEARQALTSHGLQKGEVFDCWRSMFEPECELRVD